MLNLCWPYLAQMQLEQALEINSEAIAIWRSLGNQQMLLEAHTMRLFLLSGAGALEEQLATAQEALRLSHLTGSQIYQHIALQFMGRALSSQGQFGPALINLEAALAMSEAREHPYAIQGDYDSLISFCLLTGALEQADQWADKLHEVLQVSCMACLFSDQRCPG
jgi:tetratricopeptide (TPR) repeat protein